MFEIIETKKGKYRAVLCIDGKPVLKSKKFKNRPKAADFAFKMCEKLDITPLVAWSLPMWDFPSLYAPSNIVGPIDFSVMQCDIPGLFNFPSPQNLEML